MRRNKHVYHVSRRNKEIKKSQAVIISALTEINNTLVEPTVEYLRQRKN